MKYGKKAKSRTGTDEADIEEGINKFDNSILKKKKYKTNNVQNQIAVISSLVSSLDKTLNMLVEINSCIKVSPPPNEIKSASSEDPYSGDMVSELNLTIEAFSRKIDYMESLTHRIYRNLGIGNNNPTNNTSKNEPDWETDF